MTQHDFCSYMKADAALVIDGMADAATVARVRAHCAECSCCASALEAFISVRSAVRRLGPESPSPRFDQSLREALTAHAVRRNAGARWWPTVLRVAPLAVVCLVVAVAYFSGIATRQEPDSSPARPMAPTEGVPEIRIAATDDDIYEHYAWDDPLADRASIDYDLGAAMASAFPELE